MGVRADRGKIERGVELYVGGATLAGAAEQAGLPTPKALRTELIRRRLFRPGLNQRLSAETEARIVELFDAGIRPTAIVEQTGVSPNGVKRALVRNGRAYPTRGEPKKHTHAAVAEWASLYEQGYSTTQIAEKVGVRAATIYRRLVQTGVEMRPAHKKAPSNVYPEEMIAEWIVMYRSGLSTLEIGEYAGVSNTTIVRYLRLAGVTINVAGMGAYAGKHVRPIEDQYLTMEWALSEAGAWFMGMVVTDGHIEIARKGEPNATPSLRILLKNEDAEGVVWLARAIGWDKEAVRWEGKSRNAYLRFRHPRLHFIMNELGVPGGRKSGVVVSPPQLIDNRHYWRGVVDGDGFIRIDKKGYPYVGLKNNSYPLLVEFQSYCDRHGLKAGLYNGDTVRIWGKHAVALAGLLWGDCEYTIPRKRAIAQRMLELPLDRFR